MMPRPPSSTLFPYTTLFRSDVDYAHEIAGELGYPVLLKATAAGGGIGIVRVNRPAEMANAIRSAGSAARSEEHTSELQSRRDLVCRLLLEKKKKEGSQSQFK